jgi:hypothetical protein
LRVTGDGQIPTGWTVDGTPVCVGYRNSPGPIVPDGTGGAIVPLSSSRPGSTGYDIYAMRVTGTGGTVDVPFRSEQSGSGLRLLPALPNPGRGKTRVRFELASSARVVVEILAADGRRVRRLADGLELAAGPHAISWDGLDEAGASAPAGMYVVSARAGAWMASGRLILIR